MSQPPILIELPDEAATVRLAEDIAASLKPGDVLALEGDLGAGKSTLARAVLRALADDLTLEVPSPTFTLVQGYELPRFPVHHFDLYRLTSPDELDELGLDEAIATGAVLIEWPSRAGDRLPPTAASLMLAQGPSPNARLAIWQATGPLAERFTRSRAIRALLQSIGRQTDARRYLQGDASSRAYERARGVQDDVIIMNQPPEPDTDAGRARVAYLKAAQLAEGVEPFLAVGRALVDMGLSAPRILATDAKAGFVILEDLGDTFCVAGDPPAPIPERYAAAIDVLVDLHRRDLPSQLEDGVGGVHVLPRFDRSILENELAVLLDWGVEYLTGVTPTAAMRASHAAAFAPLLDLIAGEPVTWMLRDYHSPNLLWLADRAGAARVGLLDFQDTVLGPAAYDVASLAQDARVTVPRDLEQALVERYVTARSNDVGFDPDRFRLTYAILAAQRNTRLLGLWARLLRRDGKPGYLRHYPRTSDYLERALEHPMLARVKQWYDDHLPAPIRAAGATKA
jgi:hypothetical protein